MPTLNGLRPSAFLRRSDAQPEEKVAHLPDTSLLADWLGLSPPFKRRPRSAQDSNRSNHQQPERKHSKSRNCLQSQSWQQQPLPAQHQEQQQRWYKIHHPYNRRQGRGKSPDGIGNGCDGEGKGKPLLGEFDPCVGRLSTCLQDRRFLFWKLVRENLELVDLGRLGEEVVGLGFFHQSRRHLAVEMRIATGLVVERVEDSERGWPLLDREPRDRARFSVHQRQGGAQKIRNVLLLARLRLQRNIESKFCHDLTPPSTAIGTNGCAHVEGWRGARIDGIQAEMRTQLFLSIPSSITIQGPHHPNMRGKRKRTSDKNGVYSPERRRLQGSVPGDWISPANNSSRLAAITTALPPKDYARDRRAWQRWRRSLKAGEGSNHV